MDWSQKLNVWMDKTGRDPERLASELGVTVRNVHRWKWGDETPDEVVQTKLLVLGGPTPPRAAKPKPAPPTRSEQRLDEIYTLLRGASPDSAAKPELKPDSSAQLEQKLDEILALTRGFDARLARVEAALASISRAPAPPAPEPVAAAAPPPPVQPPVRPAPPAPVQPVPPPAPPAPVQAVAPPTPPAPHPEVRPPVIQAVPAPVPPPPPVNVPPPPPAPAAMARPNPQPEAVDLSDVLAPAQDDEPEEGDDSEVADWPGLLGSIQDDDGR